MPERKLLDKEQRLVNLVSVARRVDRNAEVLERSLSASFEVIGREDYKLFLGSINPTIQETLSQHQGDIREEYRQVEGAHKKEQRAARRENICRNVLGDEVVESWKGQNFDARVAAALSLMEAVIDSPTDIDKARRQFNVDMGARLLKAGFKPGTLGSYISLKPGDLEAVFSAFA